MYDVSPDGADSSTKVDLSRRVIRLLFGDVFDRAGPFLKFEKNRHMAVRKPRFCCGSVSP